MSTIESIHNSDLKSSTTEKRPPELAMWDLPPPRRGLHRHRERDALRAELETLKINYQLALDKVADLSVELAKERAYIAAYKTDNQNLENQNRNLSYRAYNLSQEIDLLKAEKSMG